MGNKEEIERLDAQLRRAIDSIQNKESYDRKDIRSLMKEIDSLRSKIRRSESEEWQKNRKNEIEGFKDFWEGRRKLSNEITKEIDAINKRFEQEERRREEERKKETEKEERRKKEREDSILEDLEKFEEREGTRERKAEEWKYKRKRDREIYKRYMEDREKEEREEFEKNRWRYEKSALEREAHGYKGRSAYPDIEQERIRQEYEKRLEELEERMRSQTREHSQSIEDMRRKLAEEKERELRRIRDEFDEKARAEREKSRQTAQDDPDESGEKTNKKRFRDIFKRKKPPTQEDLDRVKYSKDEQETKEKKYKARREEKRWHEEFGGSNIFIVAAIFVHILKFGLDFNYGITWMIDCAFAFILYFFIFKREDRDGDPDIFIKVLVVLFLETLLPVIVGYNQTIADNKFIRYYFMNRLLTPWWFYFAIIWNNDNTRLAVICKWIVVTFWFGVFLTIPAIGFSDIPIVDYVQVEQTRIAVDLWQKSWNFWVHDIPGLISKAMMSLVGGVQRQIDYATGGYYAGRVEENQDVRLGVYLDEVKPLAPSFYRDQYVMVGGRLKVESLDDSVKVKVDCYYGKRDKNGNIPENQRAFEVYPKEEDTSYLYNLESMPVDCKFYPRSIDKGSQTVTVAADFGFETIAYIKTYFMDRETIIGLRNQGKDPLQHFKIDDPHPEARYTNGPVMIGLDIGDPPIGLSDDFGVRPRLSMTLDSNAQFGWEGKIRQLKDLSIFVPESMKLGECSHDFNLFEDPDNKKCAEEHKKYRTRQFRECLKENDVLDEKYIDDPGSVPEDNAEAVETCLIKGCKDEIEGYKRYVLADTEYRQFRNLESYATLWCMIDVSDKENIMKGEPITTQYFSVKARYDYQIEEKTKVEVKSSSLDDIYRKNEVVSTDDVGTLGRVFNNYGDIIRENDDRFRIYGYFSGEDDKEKKRKAECFIGSIIATESSGIPYAKGDVDKGGSYGLMQILSTTATDVVSKIKKEKTPDVLDNEQITLPDLKEFQGFYNPLIPEHNILVGTYYLAEQLKIAEDRVSDNTKDDVWKYAIIQYNAGPGCSDGKILNSCVEDSPEECKYKEFRTCKFLLSNYNYYKNVKGYYDLCIKNGFTADEVLKLKPESDQVSMTEKQIDLENEFSDLIKYWTGNKSSVPEKKYKIIKNGALSAMIEPGSIDGLNGHDLDVGITIKFNDIEIVDYARLAFEKKDGKISQVGSDAFIKTGDKLSFFHKKFPFIVFMVDDDLKTLTLKFDESFVKNTEKMIRNKRITDDTGSSRKYYSVINLEGRDIYANFYDGDKISLYVKNSDEYLKVCDIPWSQHRIYATNLEECPGIIVRNIDTFLGERRWPAGTVLLGNTDKDAEHYAQVQIEYDTKYKAPCCIYNNDECGKYEEKTCNSSISTDTDANDNTDILP